MNFYKFIHPFTSMVSGPSKSGKTYLVREILKNYKILTDINSETLKVIWAYGTWQEIYNEKISENVNIQYFSGLPNEEDFDYKPHILIIDDLMNELGDDKKFSNLFTKFSHHKNISIIFISQNMFHKGKQMRNVSLNCDYYVVMKSPRAKNQLQYLAREIFPGKTKYLLESYEDATADKPHSYLKIDLTQNTPDKYRISTNIIPKNKNLNIVYYLPK